MTPTDEILARLDELGVEYTTYDTSAGKAVIWTGSVCSWIALPSEYGLAVAVYKDYLTPEQAIAATVGAGTCKDLGGVGADGEAVFHCSECGCILSIFDKDGANNLCTSFIYDYPRFCPECGKRIVKDESE